MAAPAREALGQPVEVEQVVVTAPRRHPRGSIAKEVYENGRAGVSGAVDELTFGGADHGLAAIEALLGKGHGGLRQRYQEGLARRRTEDAYDAAHYGLARGAGRVAGVVGGIAVLGAPGVSRAALRLLPRGAKIAEVAGKSLYGVSTRGLPAAAATVGASSGILSQAAVDKVTGRRSTAGDYVGAGLGGVVDGLASVKLGPARGGGVGGAATSVLQDVFNGREVSIDDMGDSARLGTALGHAGDLLGTYYVARQSKEAKGEIGEMLSQLRTEAMGEKPIRERRRLYLNKGGYTVTDHQIIPDGYPLRRVREAKMGPQAKLSERQTQAREQFGRFYETDGWAYSDVGKAVGLTTAPLGAQLHGERRR